MSKYKVYESERECQKRRAKERLSDRLPKKSGNKCSNPYCKNDRGLNRIWCKTCHSEESNKYAFI